MPKAAIGTAWVYAIDLAAKNRFPRWFSTAKRQQTSGVDPAAGI